MSRTIHVLSRGPAKNWRTVLRERPDIEQTQQKDVLRGDSIGEAADGLDFHGRGWQLASAILLSLGVTA